MIVKNDWNWVSEQVERELRQDDKLEKQVIDWVNAKNIDLDRVKELYHDGISSGMENEQYLSFAEWFEAYSEM